MVIVQTTSAQEYIDQSDLDHTQRERSQVVTGKTCPVSALCIMTMHVSTVHLEVEPICCAGDFFDVNAANTYDIGYDYT